MKPKLVAILVVGILTLSVVATAVAAISQAVAEDPGASSLALGSYSFTSEIGEDSDHNNLTNAFFRVCPFH